MVPSHRHYSGAQRTVPMLLDRQLLSTLPVRISKDTMYQGIYLLFIGVAVAVYGAIRSDREALYQNNLRSKYTVDGSSPTYSFGLNLDGVDTNPDDKNKTIVYGIQFFQSPVLGIGEHNLVVTYDPTAEFNTTHFWIDYMEYL